MKVISSLVQESIKENTAITVGKFDGIHKGHELLTSKILEQEKKGLASVVFTFDVSPRLHLKKDMEKQLVTADERRELFRNEGVSYFAECSFEEEIKQLDAKEFVRLLVENFHMKYMVCGTDFRFGSMGKGDVDLLRDLAEEYDFCLEVVDKLKDEEREISSTFVREEISKGNVSKGCELLGYPYFIWGEVVHGRHLGTKIGIPTINMIPPQEKLLPANGVYITKVEIDGKEYHGVTNVGVKPTIEGVRQVGVETHILDFKQDVYSKFVRVTFLERIREEMRFSSVDELCQQMLKDKRQAINYFNQ